MEAPFPIPPRRASPSSSMLEVAYSLTSQVTSDEDALRIFATMGLQVAVCVMDTNCILSDIKHRMLTGQTPSLMQAALVGSTRMVASPQVCDEVVERLGKFAAQHRFDLAEALRVWRQEYLPRIFVVDPSNLPPLSGAVRQLMKRDPDDGPTGQLAELLQPDTLFSKDKKHLAAFGITAQDSGPIAIAYRSVARRDAVILVVCGGGHVAIVVTAEAAKAVATMVHTLVSRMDKRVLVGLAALVACVGLAAIVWPTSRRWLADRTKQPLSLVGRGFDAYSSLETRAQEARQMLVKVRRPETTIPRTAREFAALVLARARGPLTVRAITLEMQRVGYVARSTHPEQHIARVLRLNPEWFERVDTRRWCFRHQSA